LLLISVLFDMPLNTSTEDSASSSSVASDATVAPWHWTYAPCNFRGKRMAATPDQVLQLIKADKDKSGGKVNVGLIMPSTFHTLPIVHQELPKGAEMMMYAGVTDLDCKHTLAGTKAVMKQSIKDAINKESTLEELCAKCPDFANVTQAAKILCSKVAEKGFIPVCWFSGSKGYRVVWMDPGCYMRYHNGAVKGSNVVDGFMKDYLGEACLANISTLCDFDSVVYNGGNGVKSDLFQHQETKFWPILVDLSEGEGVGDTPMKRTARDDALCDKIIAFWTSVVENLPSSWAIAKPVPFNASNPLQKMLKQGSGEPSCSTTPTATPLSDRQSSACATNTLSDEELQVKLDTVAGQLVRIHPTQCCSYFDWMKVLFAVKDEMAAVGGHKVHNVLDAFSSIRAGYQGADDIASKYNQIKPRDDSQSRVKVATLVHFSQQSPALVLASHPNAKERTVLQASLDAMFRLSERREPTQSQCEEHLEKKLSEKRKTFQRSLLGLLWQHVDLSKTHWLWLTQFCSCLFDGRDQEYITNIQHHIIQEYGKCDIRIIAGELQSVWCRPKSVLYCSALCAYVQEELMKVAKSAIEDFELDAHGSESDSTTSSSTTATCANPHKRRKIAKGRASLFQGAKLLVQMDPSVLRQLLRHTRGSPSALLNLAQQHLRDPSEGEKLVKALQACFPSLVRVVAVEVIEAGDYTNDDMDEERGKEHGNEREDEAADEPPAEKSVHMDIDDDLQMHKIVPSDPSSKSNREGVCAASEKSVDMDIDNDISTPIDTSSYSNRECGDAASDNTVEIGENSTLENIVVSHGALRLKEDWTTANLSPYEMHTALLQNLPTSVEWQLAVLWTCLLIYYQRQVKADTEADAETAASEDKAGKQADEAKKQTAETEKQAAKGRKIVNKAAAAANEIARNAAEKTEQAKGSLAAAKEALIQAKTLSSKKQATTALEKALEKAEAKVKLLSEKEQNAKEKAEAAVDAAEKADAMQTRSNCTDVGAETAVAAVQVDLSGDKLPDVLEDYWEEIPCQNPLSEHEFREEWKKTHALVMKCEKSERMLLGGALWSVCFDRLFSYQAVKSRFEEKTFKVRDTKTYWAVDSQGEAIQHNMAALTGFHKSEQYWGAITPHGGEIQTEIYSLETHRFRKLPLTNRWLEDSGARAFDRIDSIPPSRDGSAVPMNIYNTWPGFHAETLPPVPDAEVACLVQPILDHLRILLIDPKCFDFFVAWLAQMIQDPSARTQVVIILQGIQGIGKDIILQFFIKRVLGAGTGFKTSNPQENVFGTHSVALQNRVFLLFDEVSGDDIRPYMSKFKDLITSETSHVNPKNKTAYDVNNLSNILGTTNSQNPIHIEPQERRFVVFECSSSKKGDVKHFESLGAHLARDDVGRAFFQYLRDHVDVRPYMPFQAHRPLTDAYFRMQQRNIPLVFKFLSAKIEEATGVANEERAEVGAEEFFQRFISWGRVGNYNVNKYTNSRFGADLSKVITELTDTDPSQCTLVKGRSSGGLIYKVNWAQLRAYLQKVKLYDQNAVV